MQIKQVSKTFCGDSQNVHKGGIVKIEKGKQPDYQTIAIQISDVTGAGKAQWPFLSGG
jgi:hypothetical protein